MNYQPFPGSAGLFNVGSSHPRVFNSTVRDSFEVIAAKLSPTFLAFAPAPDSVVGGFTLLTNAGASTILQGLSWSGGGTKASNGITVRSS